MSLLNQLRQTLEGAQILKDWLGDSGESPVSREHAERRAHSCLFGQGGNACSEHRAPRWWESAKSRIAEAIRRQLAFKHEVNLFLEREEDMKMCAVCGCCMRLKVWVPTDHIRQNIALESLKNYPSHCWIKQEILK